MSDMSVQTLVGRRGQRTPLRGTVVRGTHKPHLVSLSSLVPGGDVGVPDRMKRFRKFLAAFTDVESSTGNGTWFCVRQLPQFLDKFGDPAYSNNRRVATMARAWCKPAQEVPDAASDNDAGQNVRDAYKEGVIAALDKTMQAHLAQGDLLRQLGYNGNINTALRRARFDHHPDRARGGWKQAIVNEEIFKAVERAV